MKKLLLCAFLCAVPTISHAADARAPVAPVPSVNPLTDATSATQLAWKVAIATDDVEAAKKLVAVPGFSPLLRIDSWDRSLLSAALFYGRGDIARVVLQNSQISEGLERDFPEFPRLAQTDNLPALQFLLTRPLFVPNALYNANAPLLNEAVAAGNLEGVRALLAYPKIRVNEGGLFNRTRPLHRASESGLSQDGEIVALLLASKNIEPNALNDKGETPLHLAVANSSSLRVAEALLRDRRVKLDIADNAGQTPLDVAAKDNPYAVELLLSTGKIRPTAEQQTQIAALYARKKRTPLSAEQLKWLHILATDDLKGARAQVKKPGFDPLFVVSDDDSIVSEALGRGNVALATILLDNAKNSDYLRDAGAINGLRRTANLPVLQRFLTHSDFDPNGIEFGQPLLMAAVQAGNIEGVRALLAFANTKPDTRDFLGHNAFFSVKDAPMAQFLISATAIDPNQTDKDGVSALHWLATFAPSEVVKTMAQSPRVQADLADKDGRTALYLAATSSSHNYGLENVKALLDSGRVQIGAGEREVIDAKKARWGISESPVFNGAK